MIRDGQVKQEGAGLGRFANGFRIVDVTPETCALEFLVCSTTESLAEVVDRVYVTTSLLPDVYVYLTGVSFE